MREDRKGFYFELLDLLEKDPGKRFYADNGKDLLRNKVYECAMKMDKDLIKLLLSNDRMKEKFFTDIDGTLVFDKTAFGWAVNNKAFLQDSYTRFKNTIGLVDSREQFISSKNDVVLSFPYKDCVLEGGQTKEDQKREEILYNEILATDDIDRLLAPKVFCNITKYTENGIGNISQYNDKDNIIIKGNNLLALSSLLKRYEGKIKCIYIDPPYNTGNDSFKYNDTFSRSNWLTFMKSRLQIAKRLLSDDGLIFIQLDYNESHYGKILFDEIFGEKNFINEIIWRRKQATSFGKSKFGITNDSIFMYSKTENYTFYPIYSLNDENTQKYIKERFVYDDNDGRGKYMKSPLVNSLYRPNLKYVFKGINPPKNGWLYSEAKMQEFYDNGEIIIPDDPNARLYRKIYLSNYEGQVVQNIWLDIPIVNPMAKEQRDFQTQKPEALLERIITCCTKEGDIVLDYHLGSGTTTAVAHKLKRHYIGIEQMNYLDNVTIERMHDVIKGEQWGISPKINWQGGGSFVYCELKELNHKYIDEIQVADDGELNELYKEITESEFINYKVDINKLKESEQDFKELSTDDKRNFLIEILDKNLLYVNYCDMEDEDLAVTKEEKAFARSFYGEEV